MQNALNDYILYCRVERRLSDLTWKAYERILRCLIAFLRDRGISALTEVRTRDRASECRGQPAPDSRASRPQAPRLDAALYTGQRPPATRRRQAPVLGRYARVPGTWWGLPPLMFEWHAPNLP